MERAPASATQGKTHEDVLDLAHKLLDLTRQLAHCEEEPSAEIPPVTNACKKQLLALRQIVSSQEHHEGEIPTLGQLVARDSIQAAKTKEMLLSLIDQTDLCIAALNRRMESTAQEMALLRSSQMAIRAYRGR
jgi:hypothetical protein